MMSRQTKLRQKRTDRLSIVRSWVTRCLLGARYAAVLVALAVQKMWLSWSIHLGKWKSRLETSGRIEKKGKLKGVFFDGFGIG